MAATLALAAACQRWDLVAIADVSDHIRQILQPGGEPRVLPDVGRIYAGLDYQPLWHLSTGAEERARLLRDSFASATDHGLPPIHSRAELSRIAMLPGPRELAEADVLLTDSYLRYARRLRPAADSRPGPYWHIEPTPFDPAAALAGALAKGDFRELLRSLQPPWPQYAQLVDALRQYRMIAAAGGWPSVPAGSEIKLDDRGPRVAALHRRLMAEGDLAADADQSDIAVVREAVRRFQSRHGLDVDGRVGPRTLEQLNLGVEKRIVQIAANLDRWRRVPRDFGGRYVAVNAADATLELIENGNPTLRMRVIVGDRRHPTPVFAASIVGVTFNPPWNIPASIAWREIVPRLKRDPSYLVTHNMVILGKTQGDRHGRDIDWSRVTARTFPLRLRQLPGESNSLGRIKFEMPNRFDVYLHDTPAKALFKRPDRGLSHGCIRLERPNELASRLLAPQWDAEAVAAAIAVGGTQSVALAEPLPVYLLYWTVFVDAEGKVNFRRDLYDRDRRLDEEPQEQPKQPVAVADLEDIGCGDAAPPPEMQ